jgi:hypothetical protein
MNLIKGQLGKRTRYQMNNTSQLLVDITRKDLQQTLSNNNKINEETLILPKVKIELRKKTEIRF